MTLPDLTEYTDLLDRLVIKSDDILTADILGAVLLQEQQLVSDGRQSNQNILLPRFFGHWY
jgi:hypothetical protein